MFGYLETLSSAFASGWASYSSGRPSSVYAVLGTEILGLAVADRDRRDLVAQAERLGGRAGCFFMVFNRSVTPEEQDNISIRVINSEFTLRRLSDIKRDPYPLRQIFIFGSPRSGSSEWAPRWQKPSNYPGSGNSTPPPCLPIPPPNFPATPPPKKITAFPGRV